MILQKWRSAVGSVKVFGALLTDLSKTFNCSYRGLLIKNAYGLVLSLFTLSVIHKEKNSNFEEFLEKDNSVPIYYRNIQTLHKVAHGISLGIINEI